MTITPKQKLTAAAILTFAIALFQAVVTSVPEWARYFGAWEPVASRRWLLYLTGFAVAIIFVIFGLYALSGIGFIRRLPLLRTALVTIGVIFTLRGAFLFLEIMINMGIVHGRITIPIREMVSSAISLIIGLLYLSALMQYWSQLPEKSKPKK